MHGDAVLSWKLNESKELFLAKKAAKLLKKKLLDHQDMKTCTIEKRKGTISVNGFNVARFWADDNLRIQGKALEANIEEMQMEKVGLVIKQLVDAVLLALQ